MVHQRISVPLGDMDLQCYAIPLVNLPAHGRRSSEFRFERHLQVLSDAVHSESRFPATKSIHVNSVMCYREMWATFLKMGACALL